MSDKASTAPVKKLFIKTYGCQMNVYDSQRMAEAMGAEGYVLTEEQADPDMVLRPVALDRAALQKIGGNFDIGDDVSGIGGFVLESADRSIVLDYRFDGRLDEAWVAALPTVNTALFGDE